MKLEELARQSSGAARAAVAHLDAPALGADARNRGRMPVLLGAAAVLLVVGLGVFLALRDDPTETVTAGSGELPVLGLDDPASFGLTATGMFDPESMAEEFGVENPEVTFVYFGTPGADDPFADGDLLVGELRNETPEPLSDGTPLTVRGGLEASALDPSSDAALPGRDTIEWYEPDDGRVIQMVIASATLDVDELAAVVEQIDLSAGIAEVSLGDETTLPESARGLAPVAVEDDFPSVFGGFRALTSTIVGYERAPELSADVLASVSVASRADTIADSIVADRWWASDTEAIEVNGAAGWRFTYAFDDGTSTESFTTESVVWQWDTGVVASVTAIASGGTVSALELAEAVVELDAATIDGISDGALADQATADFDEVWGSGTGESPLSTGSVAAWSWAIGTQGNDFCTSFASGSSGASSCQPFSQVLDLAAQAPAVIDQGIMEDLQMGVIVAGADDVVVPAAGTPGDLAEVVVPNDADGTRLLVWVGPADAPARFDVLVGGEVVETLDLADGVAGIEESEPVPPVSEEEEATGEGVVGIEIDVAANPSAQSLGIAEDFSLEASGGNGRVFWVIGTHEGESYIVADGEATFAALLPDDVTVLNPTELPDGTVWTYVVARDVPECASLTGLDPAVGGQPDETTGGPGLVVWPIEGTADGSSLVFDRPDAEIREAQLQLPDVEGSIAWPDTFCGDAADSDEAAGEALSLADLDVAVLASMAAQGILVDEVVLPPGIGFVGGEGNIAAQFWRFESDGSGSTISMGVWDGGGDIREIAQDATPVDLDGRQVWVEDFGTEIRVAYPVDGLLVEVVGRNVEVDVLLDVMAGIVWLGPVDGSGASPTLEEVRQVLDGLAFTDALRVATEAGWRVAPIVPGNEPEERPSIDIPHLVTLTVTEGEVTSVDEVG